MGLWDKIKGEFIDIIQWTDPSSDTMVYRFERYGNEIKYGAKLTVREGQAAVFINEGQIADVFAPGMYELKTENMPILTTLKGWKYGFNSPFKAEVYFVSTRRFTDQKWGTKNPIMLRDPEFGPIRLRAFGTYVLRVIKPDVFIKEIVGTDGHFTTNEITDQLRNIVVTRFADALAESKIPALDLAANYNEIGDQLLDKIQSEMAEYGLELSKLLVENISLPPAVEEALDKRTSMGVIGNMQQYQQYQMGTAIGDAAKNEGMGGLAAGGLGAGMGIGMASQMAGAIQPQQPGAAPPPMPGAMPPPPPAAAQYFVAINGQQVGPFSMDVLRQQIQSGNVRPDYHVWKQGMASWLPAGQVPEIASLFSATPPPPPGPGTPPPPPGA
ncbi:MAG: DUF4339 domain-containing protein [Phycisphaera sp.]|nr:DUF4339 domain-containing protein [Phycisphaera sp.]